MLRCEAFAGDFLAQRRIAVAGVSRTEKNAPANLIYRKLRESGHDVFALNPKAGEVEGDRCYPDLKAAPPVDALVIASPAETAETLVHDCADAGVNRVWMHRSFGPGSVSEKAVAFCRDHQIEVLAGACPMMFCRPVDWGHRCMRWMIRLTGGLPG
jgi:hypothetical protein